MERGSVIDAQIELSECKERIYEKAIIVFDRKIKNPKLREQMKEVSKRKYGNNAITI
jgi:hypothetical protein